MNLRKLTDFLSGVFIFRMGYYRESELARLVNLFAHIDVEQWRGMKVLEVGAGLGYFGRAFSELGFDVTSSDGREDLVEQMRAHGRNAITLDLDNDDLEQAGNFELVLSFGVLYHLSNPEHFLRNCGKSAKALVLETIVCDTDTPVVNLVSERKGWGSKDQALNEHGCRPSPSWIEATLRSAGSNSVRDISSPLANWSKSRFDWEVRNSGEHKRDGVSLRKMWVCEKAH